MIEIGVAQIGMCNGQCRIGDTGQPKQINRAQRLCGAQPHLGAGIEGCQAQGVKRDFPPGNQVCFGAFAGGLFLFTKPINRLLNPRVSRRSSGCRENRVRNSQRSQQPQSRQHGADSVS